MIKKFISRLLIFLGIALCLIFSVNSLLQKRLASSAYYKLGSSKKILIVGHSRPECAFNDSLISNAKNLSLVAEPYFYTYIKLRKLLTANPGIKMVLIEFTNINISENNMKEWMFGSGNIPYLYPKYSSLMTFSEKSKLFLKRPIEFLKTVSLDLNSNLIFSLNRSKDLVQFKQMGGYRIKEGSFVDSLKKISKDTMNKVADKIAIFNLEYLDKIISLCRVNNINLFFLRSPVHPLYGLGQLTHEYDSVLQTRYPQMRLIDFANYRLNDEEYFDFHHLNNKGAVKVSKSMDSVLRLIDQRPLTTLFVNNRMLVNQ